MKRFTLAAMLTAMCFLLLADGVHAWEIPTYMRISSGTRMWFSVLEGDLIQSDRTKLGLGENLGIKKEKLTWEFFWTLRLSNIHVIRLVADPFTVYESSSESSQKIRTFRLGYDLDFVMTPQILFGANLEVLNTTLDTTVKNATAGLVTYDYTASRTRTMPQIGLHGSFYPILDDISLRPNISARVNWWNYENTENWDWEVSAAVDIPVNRLWTWNVNGGYRSWHTKFNREKDTIDINRTGFFLEYSLLF